MGRYLVVAVADGQGAGGFEEEDRGGRGGVRLVFDAAGDRVDRALGQDDVGEGTNPFEVGVATELFGLPRPELGLAGPLYDVTLCAPTREVRMNHGFFTLTGVPGMDAVDDADTLVVPGRPDNVVPRGPPSSTPSGARTRVGHA